MTRVIAGQCLPQLWNASLPSIEGLAVGDAFLSRSTDEIWCRKITLSDPKRNQSFAPTPVIGDCHNPAFRRMCSFPTKVGYECHDFPALNFDFYFVLIKAGWRNHAAFSYSSIKLIYGSRENGATRPRFHS